MSFKSWSETKGNVNKKQAQNENGKVQDDVKPSAEAAKKAADKTVESKS